MTSISEICDLLGAHWDGTTSKGRPSFIFKHLERFSLDWSSVSDASLLAQFFLAHHGKKLFGHEECSPKLPDHETEILSLVSQAFRLLRHVPATENKLSASSPGDSAAATISQEPLTPPAEGSSMEAEAVEPKEHPKVKTGETRNSLTNAKAIDPATDTPPKPVTTSSKHELVALLKDWIEEHPNLRIPELAKYDRNFLENNFAIEASLVETGERIWIIRLGVIDLYQGWVLEKPDGSNMLVKAQYRKGGYVYYPWLGGEFGYSDEAVAHHQDVPRSVLTLRLYARKRQLDAEDVLNEYDISEAALEAENPQSVTPDANMIIEDSQESDTPLSSPPSDSEASDMINWGSNKRRSRANPYVTKGTKSRPNKQIKTSNSMDATFNNLTIPSPSHTPPASANTIRTLMEIQDPHVRSKVKKLHKIFPAMTLAVCESVLLKNKCNIDDAIDDLDGIQNIPTSTDATFSDDTPPAMATRARRAARDHLPQTPSPSRRSKSNAPKLATPFSTDQSTVSFGYPTPKTPSFRSISNAATTINFFLSNPSMGAVPFPFASIKSMQKFFIEAIAAHFLTSHSISDTDKESVVAASVTVSGMNHAIVVRKNKVGNPAWDEVGRIVKEMEKMGRVVEVEVSCIVQHVAEVVRKGRRLKREHY
ncbi:MAG: hypothetical protein Q9213_000705 [Squamulea squamosa]